MLRRFLCGTAFAAALFPAPAASAGGIDSKIRKIEDEIARSNAEFSALSAEINKLAGEIRRLNEEKESTSAEIDAVAANISVLTAKISNLNNDYKNRRDKLNGLIAELEQADALGRESKKFIEENAAVIQKLGIASGREEMMTLHDFEEGSGLRIKTFVLSDLILKADGFAENCSARAAKLALERKSVEKKIEELEAALGDFSSKVASSKRIQLSHRRALEKMKRREETLRKEIREKEKSRKEIDRLLESFIERKKDLLAEKEREREMEALRGKMPWPVAGSIVSFFGKHKHPVLDTYMVNRGIKIEASTTCVSSVRAGTVSFAGYFKGYGKTVIIEHGGGFYTVTAGLSDIDVKKDEKVETASGIGTVAPGECVYFEIRRGSVPEDPRLWLLKK